MFKKRGFILLICLVLALALAACSSGTSQNQGNSGGGGGSNSGTTGGSTNTGNAGGSNDETITLRFLHWVSEEVGHWEDVIALYEAEHPNVKIESVPLVNNNNSYEYFKKLDLLAAAGDPMDLIMFSNGADYAKRIDAGLLTPIDDFLAQEGIDIESEYNNTYGKVNGHYYGLPMKYTMNLVMINKNHLDEAGLPIPTDWTWDDYAAYAKAMTKGDRYGSYLHSWHQMHSVVKLLSSSEEPSLFKADGSHNLDNPLVRASLEFRYQLEQVDKSSVPYLEIFSQQLNYRQQFFSGRASMIPIGSYMLTEWGEYRPDFEIVWAPWPKNDPNGKNYTVVGGDVIGIAEASKHKEEAYKFLRWLTTEGITQQGVWVPAWKGGEMAVTIERLVQTTPNPDKVHKESFVNVIANSTPVKGPIPPSYSSEGQTEFGSEVDLYLLGEQDLDTTLAKAIDKVQKIIDSNK